MAACAAPPATGRLRSALPPREEPRFGGWMQGCRRSPSLSFPQNHVSTGAPNDLLPCTITRSLFSHQCGRSHLAVMRAEGSHYIFFISMKDVSLELISIISFHKNCLLSISGYF